MAEEQGQFSRDLPIQTEIEQENLATQEVAEEIRTQELQEEAYLDEQAEENEFIQASELAAAQEADSIQRQGQDLYNQGMAFTGPSMLKWGSIFTLAIINDIIDVLVLTGVLEILSWLISLGLTALILIILWMMDGDLKRAQTYAINVKDKAQQIQLTTQMTQIEGRVKGMAEGIAGKLKNIPGFKNISIRETPRKNPLARALMGSAVESIPYIGAINLITIWVFFAYLAERSAHKNARESAEEAYGQFSRSAAQISSIMGIQ